MEYDLRAGVSKKRLWTGRILSGIVVLFLIFDATMKLMVVEPVIKGMGELGFPVPLAPVIGTILLICTALYAIPRTAPLEPEPAGARSAVMSSLRSLIPRLSQSGPVPTFSPSTPAGA